MVNAETTYAEESPNFRLHLDTDNEFQCLVY